MIRVDTNIFNKTMMRDCKHPSLTKRKRFGKSPTNSFFNEENEYETKERFYHFDHTPIDDAEMENGCYDIVIVEGWQPEQSLLDGSHDWAGEGELLAEIHVEAPRSPPRAPSPPSPPASEDCANLSWLLNFRLDELISSHCDQSPGSGAAGGGGGGGGGRQDALPGTDTPYKEQDPSRASPPAEKKPPYTYTELIELALREKGELTVSGIYQWISEKFPFFKPQDDRWKNSVRHNLSINPHFRKGAKAARGAGHLWTIAEPSAALDRVLANACSARRLQAAQSLEQEVAAAAASILQHHTTEFLNPVSAEQVAAECGLLDGDLTFHY